MIVKDEAHVIERCLNSIRPIIHGYSIVDTGSSDNTKEIIRKVLSDIPGKVHSSSWVNFGFNRSEAFEIARKDPENYEYIVTIDADEVMKFPSEFALPYLSHDSYMTLHLSRGSNEFWRNQFFKRSVPWRYEGVVHEHPACDRQTTLEKLHGPICNGMFDSARNKNTDKYLKDAELLLNSHIVNPNNERTVFYLAQSYKDAKIFDKAIEFYSKRSKMPGWDEETWYSLYQIGLIREIIGDMDGCLLGLLRAYSFRPSRAEPLYHLARIHRSNGEFHAASMYARQASKIGLSDDILFLDSSIYKWRILDELSLALYYTGELKESKTIMEKLISMRLDRENDNRIKNNYSFFKPKS